jgi:hypothetical protein
MAAVSGCGAQSADQAANKKKKPAATQQAAGDKPAVEAPTTTVPVTTAVETADPADEVKIEDKKVGSDICIVGADPAKEPAKQAISDEDAKKLSDLKAAAQDPANFKEQAARLDQIPFNDEKVGPKQQARAADYADYFDGEAAIGEFPVDAAGKLVIDRWHAVRGAIDADAQNNKTIADAFEGAHSSEIDGALNNDFEGPTGAKFWRWYMKVLEQPFPENYPNYRMNVFSCGAWVASTVPAQWKATATAAAKDLRDKFVYKVAVGDPGTLTWFRKEAARALAESHDEQVAIYNATIAYCLRID